MEEQLSNATWRTAAGKQIEVEDMDDNHLINSFVMIMQERRGFTPFKFWNGHYGFEWEQIFETELECRGLYDRKRGFTIG